MMSTPDQADKDAGYERCVDAMRQAARAWVAAHPLADLRFNAFETDLAREAGRQPHESIAVIAALPDVIDRWAGNADTRAFLRALEEASEGQATYLQAKMLIEQAWTNAIAGAQGEQPEGDWRCVGCATVNDGFTPVDGKPTTPGPGSLSVCFSCAALQQVGADGKRFAPLSTRELNALPKSVRVSLLRLKHEIENRVARERARS